MRGGCHRGGSSGSSGSSGGSSGSSSTIGCGERLEARGRLGGGVGDLRKPRHGLRLGGGDGARDGGVLEHFSEHLRHEGLARAASAHGNGALDAHVRAVAPRTLRRVPRERKRVYDEGGRVEFCGCWRVIAENRGRNVRAALAVSRAIGDIDFKRPENKGVTTTPDVARVTLDDEIENVIVATDGLWDVIGDQDAVRLCRSVLRGRFSEDACREAAEALTQEALERGSSDNVTVVVCCFQH